MFDRDKLAVVRHLLEEHGTIREQIKLLGDSITDREALTALQKAHAEWMPGRPVGGLPEKQKRLYQLMSSLEEGLSTHFADEDKVLPPILGELLAKAIKLDHRELEEEIVKVKSIVAYLDTEESSREQVLSKESNTQDMLSSMIQKKVAHMDGEEMILNMALRALEHKERLRLVRATDE
ncbi:hemerythrin domain-containing protein [Chloroflexota bacterium]